MIKDIVKYIYRKNRENFTVNCIILLCGCILMGILFDNISVFYNDQKQSVDKLDPQKEYQLTNTIVEIQNFSSYFKDESHLENMKLFYKALNNSDKFMYLDKFEQCMYMENRISTNIFACGYEDGEPEYYEDDDGTIKYAIKNVTIGKNTQDYYDFKVTDGRLFNDDDFEDNQIIPVILGAEYKDYYEVGDRFSAEYLFEPKDYEVIGFLEEDTAVISQGGIIYLDRYMISPSIIMDEPPTTWDELMYQAYAYEEKIEGDAVLTENYSLAEFTADIEQLTNRYSMFDIQIVTPNASFLDTSLILSCYMGKNMFFLLAGIIFLVLTIINWCFSVNLFKMLSNYFGVQILNGCNENILFNAVFIYKSVFMLSGIAGAVFLLMCMQQFNMFVVIASIIYIVINTIIDKVILRKMLDQDIDHLLRSK